MSDTAQTEKKQKKTENSKKTLAKIEPVKKHNEVETPAAETPSFANEEASGVHEQSLITAVRNFLREFGIRKSAAAIRNAVEMPHDEFLPQHAVSALSVLGFKSGFGNISVKKLTKEHLPLIAFLKSGEAVVLKEMQNDTEISMVTFGDKKSPSVMSVEEFKDNFSGVKP